MKLTTAIAISFFVGCLGAQTDQTTQTTTTTTTTNVDLNGTLVDQGCYTTHTQKTTETTSNENSTTTTETTRIESECPASATSTSFGLLTPEGKFIRFDDAGNSRVLEMVKTNKDWRNYIVSRKPVKVRVMGTADGDAFVLKEIR
jgi:hypothetical protein